MDKKATIRLVIADDHPIFREGLRKLLETDPEFVVVGEAGDGEQTLEVLRRHKPDILLLDLAMPRLAGLDVLAEIEKLGLPVRTILLTASLDKAQLLTALQRGARGAVLKEVATPQLFKCIRAVMAGQYWVGRGSLGDLIKTLKELTAEVEAGGRKNRYGLTRRELEIIAAVVAGETNKGIAERYSLSEDTVKHHLTHIFDKLGVFTRLELALFAIHHGLVPSDRPPTSSS
jgi:DNA-binding NarL/FixJ family response regulator